MEYRKLEKLGISVSLLGYGCMRFPTDKSGKIDEAKSEELLDLAYNQGVNYFDTAYIYHGGESETFTGKVLSKYDRSSYYIATKLPCWEVKSLDDAKRIFEDQLKRLDKDYIDFYLLHSMTKETWNKMNALGIPQFVDRLREEGKIRYIGFSFHDSYEVFEEILTSREWDFCQIQLNYMDVNEQAGIKGYQLAERLGVPVIVMEPVKGGLLASLPDDITGKLKGNHPSASIASWALRWVGSLPDVKVILSGMSTMEQVMDNLNTFGGFVTMTEQEQKLIREISVIMNNRVKNGCTGCRYCMPCPKGVDIPRNFGIWNGYGTYQNKHASRWQWTREIPDAHKANHCISCGLCEKACPQKIEIRKDLIKLQRELDSL